MTNVYVLYDVLWSDHFPLVLDCNLGLIRQKINLFNQPCNEIRWDNRKPEQVAKYQEYCDSQLKHIDFPDKLRGFADGMCKNTNHNIIIDNYYHSIVNVLSQASKCSWLRNNGAGGNRNKYVKGWNKHVAEAHRQARLDFQLYVLHGKPESGPVTKKCP